MTSEMRVHHYGLAVGDIEKAARSLSALGYEVGEKVFDPVQGVNPAFARNESSASIELVCDVADDGPTGRIVRESGPGLYHVCYEVDDIEVTIDRLRDAGFLLRHKTKPAIAFNGRKIAWLYNRQIGLVELLESSENSSD